MDTTQRIVSGTFPIRLAMAGITLLLTSTLFVSQNEIGRIQGRVTRSDSSEGVVDAQITIQGPSPVLTTAALSPLYTPNMALTQQMRDQIDAQIAASPATITAESIAAAASRMEAQLLGLPVPPNLSASAELPKRSVTTDSSGHFTFTNLKPGRYQIRVQRDGYFGVVPPGGRASEAPTIVTTTANVVAGQPAPEVGIVMVQGGTLSGKVRDPGGEPAFGVQIGAYDLVYQSGRLVLQLVRSKQTDTRGEYRLYPLPPGEYLIAANPRRSDPAQETQARTYFPSTIDARTATRMKITQGAEVSGVDLGIRADAAAIISGRAVTSIAALSPPSARSFFLFPREAEVLSDAGIQTYPNVAANQDNGQFEIRGVLPGSYDLVTFMLNGNGETAMGRARVDVGNGNLNDVIVDVENGREVRARLVVDDDPVPFTMAAPQTGIVNDVNKNGVTSAPALVPTPAIRIGLRSMESYPFPFESAAAFNSRFEPSGIFVFPNVPGGRYYIQLFSLPSRSYIRDVRVGGRSVYDDGFDVESLQGQIEVSVSSKAARIQGSVVDAAENAFASARIVLVPPPSRRQNILLYKTVQSDSKGNFTLNGVAPGEYKLFAWENVPVNAWMNAEFMAQYESGGQIMRVTEGESVTTALSLTPITAITH